MLASDVDSSVIKEIIESDDRRTYIQRSTS